MTDKTLAEKLDAAMNAGEKTMTLDTRTVALMIANRRTSILIEDAAFEIIRARDHNAEFGAYPEGTLGADQAFDDWAADLLDAAIKGGVGETLSERLMDRLMEGVAAGRAVVENWSSGDLAGAVNGLDGWVDEMVAEFPETGPLEDGDDEDADDVPDGYLVEETPEGKVAVAFQGTAGPTLYPSRAYAISACAAHAQYGDWPLA